jgi:hypothetical protein
MSCAPTSDGIAVIGCCAGGDSICPYGFYGISEAGIIEDPAGRAFYDYPPYPAVFNYDRFNAAVSTKLGELRARLITRTWDWVDLERSAGTCRTELRNGLVWPVGIIASRCSGRAGDRYSWPAPYVERPIFVEVSRARLFLDSPEIICREQISGATVTTDHVIAAEFFDDYVGTPLPASGPAEGVDSLFGDDYRINFRACSDHVGNCNFAP